MQSTRGVLVSSVSDATIDMTTASLRPQHHPGDPSPKTQALVGDKQCPNQGAWIMENKNVCADLKKIFCIKINNFKFHFLLNLLRYLHVVGTIKYSQCETVIRQKKCGNLHFNDLP